MTKGKSIWRFVAVRKEGLVHGARFLRTDVQDHVGYMRRGRRRYIAMACEISYDTVVDRTANYNIRRITCLTCLLEVLRSPGERE
jgi:hypothetical protein